jgi:hypothetical protein
MFRIPSIYIEGQLMLKIDAILAWAHVLCIMPPSILLSQEEKHILEADECSSLYVMYKGWCVGSVHDSAQWIV